MASTPIPFSRRFVPTLVAPRRRKENWETLINRIKKNQNRQGTLATSLLANNIKRRGALLLLVAPATKQHSSFFYYIVFQTVPHSTLTHSLLLLLSSSASSRRTQKRDRNSFEHTNELPGPYTYVYNSCTQNRKKKKKRGKEREKTLCISDQLPWPRPNIKKKKTRCVLPYRPYSSSWPIWPPMSLMTR